MLQVKEHLNLNIVLCILIIANPSNKMVTEMTDSNTARNWFDENWFNSGIDKIDNVKWTFVAMNLSRKIVLNPRYPDTILYIEERKFVKGLALMHV